LRFKYSYNGYDMEIIPAVDIKGGKCVRLYQGDYSQETVFSEDPVAVALNWQAQGASWLHLVDLDGAASGEPRNIDVVEAIVKRVNLPVQLGGGIRDEATVAKMLDIGVNRVILGTAAVENPDMVKRLCQKHGEAIIIGVDARYGCAAIRGWQKDTEVTALELGRRMADLGVRRIIYTDIKRDGTLTEPDFEAITELVKGLDLLVIAAGGISALDHLRKLKQVGVEGAILGKALYTGDIKLREALALGL
jgi:phosphoribosylformimino-5-aminoimidazole carboxamide ribotide isomerase